jgi:hypothetical protein
LTVKSQRLIVTKTTTVFFTVLFTLVASAVGYLVSSVNWNRNVVIEGGAKDGFLYQTGQQIEDWLRGRGVNSRLIQRDDTVRIIQDVNDPASPVNVGFLAQPVLADNYPNVTSLGTIAKEPLLIFSRAELGETPSIYELRGKRVEIGQPESGGHSLTIGALQAYGIADEVEFRENSLATGIENVLNGKSDAVAALRPVNNSAIEELEVNPAVRLTSLPNPRSLAATLGYSIEPTKITAGAFSIPARLPASDVETIAVPVTVIAKASLADGNAMKIVEFLKRTFSQQSALTPANTYPTLTYNVPPHPAAITFYSSGLPWQYTVMPAPIAEIFGPLIALGSLSLLLITLYKFVFPDLHGTLDKILGPRERQLFIRRLEHAQQQGNPITKRQRKRLQRYIDRHDRDRTVWDKVQRLQKHFMTADNGTPKQ